MLYIYKPYKFLLPFLLAFSFCNCGSTGPENDAFARYPDETFGDVDYSPAWSSVGNWIAFRHGPQDKQGSGIYLIMEDGTNEKMLVQDGLNPNWSYDDSQIICNILGQDQIYSFDIITDTLTQLTAGPYRKNYPSWHPSSQKILYTVMAPDSAAGIWTYDLISGTSTLVAEIGGNQPKWNLQGDAIIFYYYDGSTTYLSLIRFPSKQLDNLLDIKSISDGHIRYPSFNPDGTQIAFYTSESAKAEATIWVYDLTRRSVKELLRGGNSPSWSPDGQSIVFVRHLIHSTNVEGNGYLWILSIPTGTLRRLTYD